MLEFLRIQNLALIEDLEMEFAPGLNVLTGESGAGKSFILRALDFILGEKLGPGMIRSGREKALVEAVFQLPEGETLLRRELTAETGRSRVYVNDRLSSQDKVRQMRPRLIIHTSQHAQQRLLRPSYHQQLLDTYLPQELRRKREELVARLKELRSREQDLVEKTQELESKREFLEYQQHEIRKVDPKPGEMDELENRKQVLRDQAQAQTAVNSCLDLLYGDQGALVDRIHDLQREVRTLASLDGEYTPFDQQLEDVRQVLMDFGSSLKQGPGGQESERELEEIESRLWQLSQLQRRMNRTLEQLLDLDREIEDNLSFLDTCHLELSQIDRELKQVHSQLADIIDEVNAARRSNADKLCSCLQNELQQLGFSSDVQVRFDFSTVELAPGIEEIQGRLLWVPNPGQPPQPLDQIASGGELSRFLLALVGLTAGDEFPTLLFDEVDAGIGGLILGQVGRRIQELARHHQVILISHWPQLASLAECHFKVYKEIEEEQTFTFCTRLQGREVEQELSRMAGGGDQGRAMARQFLEGT
ncbi:DNA repair protein RecN [Desulfovermiculus halophilus]|uniref:DNA repair protein RecN n=1 Tax=Desulfovermiculus halophilus TaxID=339722 RepID=UPI000484F7B5|nr:AAA family ATPase [Desulfovermiculus halophilus]